VSVLFGAGDSPFGAIAAFTASSIVPAGFSSAVDEAAVVASEVVFAATSAAELVVSTTAEVSAVEAGDESSIQSLPNAFAKPTRMEGLAKALLTVISQFTTGLSRAEGESALVTEHRG
jgi:hypothetical protein